MALLNLLFLLITTVNVKKVEGVDVLSIARLHSNPTIQWYTNMSDHDSVVRIRLIGPADRWFAIGIGNTSMDNTYTFVVYGDGTVSERRLGFHNAGDPLPTQETDLNITFVNEENGIREIEISRGRVGYSNLFYTFPNSRLSSVALIAAWSMSAGDLFGHYHGEKNRLYHSIDFSLSNETTPDPTNAPTRAPTQAPTLTPTISPTLTPSISPTLTPTVSPTQDFRNRYDLYGMATVGGQHLDNIQLVIGIEYETNTVFINITGPTATWFAIGFGSDYIYDTPSSSSMKGKYAIIIDWTREGNAFSVIDDQHILEYFLDDHYVNIQQPLNKFVQRKIQQHPDQTERFRRNVLMQRPTFKVNDSNGEYFNFSTCNRKYKIIWARGQYSPYKANAFGGGAGHTATDRGTGSVTVQGALFDDCNSVKSLFDKINIISIIVITVYAIENI